MDSDWATKGAPDAISAGHAARVLDGLNSNVSAQHYLMTHDGLSRHQADELVKACRVKSGLWDKIKAWFS